MKFNKPDMHKNEAQDERRSTWRKPTITRIEMKRTLFEVGSQSDLNTTGSISV